MTCDTNSKPWRRKMDDPNGPPAATPLKRFLPDDWQCVRDVIAEAEQLPEGARPAVRACGSHWAFSDAAVTDGYAVETHDPDGDRTDGARPRLNRPLKDVIGRCLTYAARRFFEFQGVTDWDPKDPLDHGKFGLIHVEAGIKVAELYSILDAGDGTGGFDGIAQLYPVYRGPWAMGTLGGAGGQTIVGAFSTGTHGGDVKLAPIADAVMAVHLFGANGEQYWIEKQFEPCMPLVEEDELRRLYGPITIKRSDELMRAVMVACGRFGIIYSVVLKIVRQYALKEERTESDWTSVRTWVNQLGDPNFSHRFVQIVVNPMGQWLDPGEHTCYVTLRDAKRLEEAGDPPAGRAERTGLKTANSWPYDPDVVDGGSTFLNRVCLSPDPLKAFIDELKEPVLVTLAAAVAAEAAATLALASPLIVSPLALAALEKARAAAAATAATALASLAFLTGARHLIPDNEPLGAGLAALANNLTAPHDTWLMRAIAGFVIGMDQAPRTMTAISYAVMDIHNYLDVNCTRNGDSIEIFFDASSPELPLFMDRVFQRVDELESGLLTGDRRVFAGYISLRYMHITDALIGMQRWGTTCSIEIASLNAIDGTQPFLEAVEADAIEMGATLHWGQRNHMTMKMVEACYNANPGGLLYRWRTQLAELTRNGRDAAFSTAFTRRTGLEVVQPKVHGFAVHPDTACAGAMVDVTWDALDNPPGTQAAIEVRSLASGGPPSAIITLPALGGTRPIAMPAGRNELRLVTAYTLNGRTLIAGRTLECWGVQDGETWRFELLATCLRVEGLWRWGVNIVLAGTVSPDLYVDELSCRFSSAFTWVASRYGGPEVEFSWLLMNPWRKLSPRPRLQGDWTFYVKEEGCKSPEPGFWAEFKLACGP